MRGAGGVCGRGGGSGLRWLVVDDLPPSSSPFPASFNYSSTSYSAFISLSSFLHHRFHLF